MIEYIYTDDPNAKTHAVVGRERVPTDFVWNWRATTFCGKQITGHSGVSGHDEIVDCKSCQRVMSRPQ